MKPRKTQPRKTTKRKDEFVLVAEPLHHETAPSEQDTTPAVAPWDGWVRLRTGIWERFGWRIVQYNNRFHLCKWDGEWKKQSDHRHLAEAKAAVASPIWY